MAIFATAPTIGETSKHDTQDEGNEENEGQFENIEITTLS